MHARTSAVVVGLCLGLLQGAAHAKVSAAEAFQDEHFEAASVQKTSLK
ncbi:MAG TPA: hypothetical protein VLI06_01180 [Solimonas sp.]|nr:hypothetical protein [Solimonas sp.]